MNISVFGEITQSKGYYALFKVIQGRRVWYQSKAHMQYPISDQYQLTSYLAPFPRYGLRQVKNRYIGLPLLRLTPDGGVTLVKSP